MYYLYLFGLIVNLAYGSFISREKCPDVPVAKNIGEIGTNVTGGWYVLKLSENDFDTRSRCIYNKINQLDQNLYNATYSVVFKNKNERVLMPVIGRYKTNSSIGDFDMTITYNDVTSHLNVQYLVIKDNYIIVWRCTNSGNYTLRDSWLQARYKVLSTNEMNEIEKFYKKYKLGWSELVPVDHDNCVYDDV